MTSTKVQLALSTFLDNWTKQITTKAMAGNAGAIKALSMLTPLRPLIIRELRKITDEDAAQLVAEVRKFLEMVENE